MHFSNILNRLSKSPTDEKRILSIPRASQEEQGSPCSVSKVALQIPTIDILSYISKLLLLAQMNSLVERDTDGGRATKIEKVIPPKERAPPLQKRGYSPTRYRIFEKFVPDIA